MANETVKNEYKDVLDELFSMSDGELGGIFSGCTDPEEILRTHSLLDIDEKLREYAEMAKTRNSSLRKKAEVPDVITLNWLIGQDEGYTESEISSLLNHPTDTRPQGVVLWYDTFKDEGWIFRQHKKTVRSFFIKSGAEPLKLRLKIGDKVEFTPFLDENGRLCAKDPEKIGRILPSDRSLEFSFEGKSFDIHPREVLRYGKTNSMSYVLKKLEGKITEEELAKKGYVKSDFDCVYVATKHRGEFRFYKEGSPMKGDAQVKDLNIVLRDLDERIFHFNYAPQSVRTKEEKLAEKENREKEQEKKEALARKTLWFKERLTGEILRLGYSKKDAVEMIKSLGNMEKKVKNGIIKPVEESIFPCLKSVTKQNPIPNRTSGAERHGAWFRCYVKAELYEAGYSVAETKALLAECDFAGQLGKKTAAAILEESPLRAAKRIMDGMSPFDEETILENDASCDEREEA